MPSPPSSPVLLPVTARPDQTFLGDHADDYACKDDKGEYSRAKEIEEMDIKSLFVGEQRKS